jgi:CheY-like chemotaxis protein
MLTRLIGEHIRIEARLDPSLGQTRVDPGQIEQVLTNLAVNARDAMPRGGVLRFTTTNRHVDPGFAAGVGIAAGLCAVLTVTDTGDGMPREVADRVFEPFFTTKKERGTGLGLAVVHGIIKGYAGHIEVASEIGRGTTFTILLPHDRAAREATAPVAGSSALPRGTETVLVVEDEPSVRSTTALMLRRHGYQVEEAASGDEALRVWQRRGADIDLLLTDLVIPGMTGSELALRLSALRPGLPVVFTSGYSEDTLDSQGLSEKNTFLLPKPYTQAALLQKVRAVLDGSPRA